MSQFQSVDNCIPLWYKLQHNLYCNSRSLDKAAHACAGCKWHEQCIYSMSLGQYMGDWVRVVVNARAPTARATRVSSTGLDRAVNSNQAETLVASVGGASPALMRQAPSSTNRRSHATINPIRHPAVERLRERCARQRQHNCMGRKSGLAPGHSANRLRCSVRQFDIARQRS